MNRNRPRSPFKYHRLDLLSNPSEERFSGNVSVASKYENKTKKLYKMKAYITED